jgi:hypothetical protein
MFIVAVLATSFTTCNKDDTENGGGGDVTIFKAVLYGYSEVPPNASTATGATTLTFNKSTMKFTAVTTYTGLTPTAGHIHKAAVGVNGDVVFPFVITPSPITLQSGILTQAQIDDLFNGMMYVNLHTTAYPGGEIRGQLIKQ